MKYRHLTVATQHRPGRRGRKSEVIADTTTGVLWLRDLDLRVVVARNEAVLSSGPLEWYAVLVSGRIAFTVYNVAESTQPPRWYASTSAGIEAASSDPYVTAAKILLETAA
ncbi:MAG TPA: hypothetical protein PLN64_05850 [Candidatus Bipolaricaulis anaerobius]|nr:hypothetical protein [Candidatus Bipolaricaulis anaerobius]